MPYTLSMLVSPILQKAILFLSFLFLAMPAQESGAQFTPQSEQNTNNSALRGELDTLFGDKDKNPFGGLKEGFLNDPFYDAYLKPTVPNLSHLYWKLGAYKEITKDSIDNYLLINECDIYKKYFHNDFQWKQISEITSKNLLATKDSFSSKFKFMFPVDFGRYDDERKGFPLINSTALYKFHRMEVFANKMNEKICGYDRAITAYPRNIMLALTKPLNLDFIPVDYDRAQLFLKRYKERIGRTSKRQDRRAFIRLRINFFRHLGVTRGLDNQPIAIVYGDLEGIDFFEQETEEGLLAVLDYTYKEGTGE